MPFLTYDPLPQCLQQSPLTPLLLARGHQRGSRRYLSDVKCLRKTCLLTPCRMKRGSMITRERRSATRTFVDPHLGQLGGRSAPSYTSRSTRSFRTSRDFASL